MKRLIKLLLALAATTSLIALVVGFKHQDIALVLTSGGYLLATTFFLKLLTSK